MGMFASPPPTVNERGDTLSSSDFSTAVGIDNIFFHGPQLKLTPQQRGEMLHNWLTAGGKPKPVDVSKIFAEKEAMAPVEDKAAAGQGINSMFGFGNLIGDLQPVKPVQMIEPLNQSPMQPGVPYSVPPVAGAK